MSFILNRLQAASTVLRNNLSNKSAVRQICISLPCRAEAEENEDSSVNDNNNTDKSINSEKDRSRVIPVETSIAYLMSNAYKECYGNNPVWKLYRRNHKGSIPPKKTRKTCIRNNMISTGSPCPICRDEYLVLDYRNTKLLKQFISEYNGEILSYSVTNICQMRHKQLLIEVHKAKNCGTITFDLPIRHYDYSEWNPAAVKA